MEYFKNMCWTGDVEMLKWFCKLWASEGFGPANIRANNDHSYRFCCFNRHGCVI